MNNGNNVNNVQVSDDRLVMPQNNAGANGNTFFNNSEQVNNTQLDLSNTPVAPVDYSQDATVQENLGRKKSNSVSITSDGMVFIVIAIILLIFIFFLPTIYGYFN